MCLLASKPQGDTMGCMSLTTVYPNDFWLTIAENGDPQHCLWNRTICSMTRGGGIWSLWSILATWYVSVYASPAAARLRVQRKLTVLEITNEFQSLLRLFCCGLRYVCLFRSWWHLSWISIPYWSQTFRPIGKGQYEHRTMQTGAVTHKIHRKPSVLPRYVNVILALKLTN